MLGIFASGYRIHQYRQWLLGTVATILDAELSIGSAGLLRGGAVAWVSVEVPDTVTTPEGVAFRPNLLACTSHDGSLATTYQRVVTNVVCDNTMSAALTETGPRLKVRHSRNSLGRLGEARDALGIVHSVADDFAAQVAELCRLEVSDADWRRFLNAHAPIPDRMPAPRAKTRAAAKQVTLDRLWNHDARVSPWRGTAWGVVQAVNTYTHHDLNAHAPIPDRMPAPRAKTRAAAKQVTLDRLWNHDARVSPWRGTAWGVVQAVNTYTHHDQAVRGADRAERNMLRAVQGGADTLDRATLTTLRRVLA